MTFSFRRRPLESSSEARVGGRSLGVLLDTGHLNVTASTLGFDRLELVDAVAGRVGAFHLHDNDGAVDEHRPVEEGSWALDVVRRERFAAIPVTVEARVPGAAELAAYIARLQAMRAVRADALR